MFDREAFPLLVKTKLHLAYQRWIAVYTQVATDVIIPASSVPLKVLPLRVQLLLSRVLHLHVPAAQSDSAWWRPATTGFNGIKMFLVLSAIRKAHMVATTHS